MAYCRRLAAYCGLALILLVSSAQGRDLGQWTNIDPLIADWFAALKQPDNPRVSCCGDADAYWADKTDDKDGATIAIITDTRPDGPLRRRHIEAGTRIAVPPNKVRRPPVYNPTGHTVIFLQQSFMLPLPYPQYAVLCYEPLPLF